MRFFKANQPPRSPADEAAAVRLMAIASRGKASGAPEWATEPPLETPDEPTSSEVPQ
jgi:hypothetical protein